MKYPINMYIILVGPSRCSQFMRNIISTEFDSLIFVLLNREIKDCARKEALIGTSLQPLPPSIYLSKFSIYSVKLHVKNTKVTLADPSTVLRRECNAVVISTNFIIFVDINFIKL